MPNQSKHQFYAKTARPSLLLTKLSYGVSPVVVSVGVLECSANSVPGWPPNPPTRGLFHATAAPNRDCAGAGCGERRAVTQKRTFNKKAPVHLAPPPPREARHYHQRNLPAAAVVWPSVGVGVFRATTETRTGARASADRRPSCVLCRRSFGERRARDSSHVHFAAVKTNSVGLHRRSPAAESTTKPHPASVLCLPKYGLIFELC